MTKKVKLFSLLILLSILLILVLFLIFTSASAKKTYNNTNRSVKNLAVPVSDEDYKTKVKAIFALYEARAQNKAFSIENVSELKNQLLGLNVPAGFKNLHLNFVLALTRLEDYLNRKDEQVENSSFQMFNQLKADNSWLNN